MVLSLSSWHERFFLVVFQRRSHRGVCTLKMQSVTVNKCMYVYIEIKIKNKRNKKIHYFKWHLNNKANIIGNKTFKVIMMKMI